METGLLQQQHMGDKKAMEILRFALDYSWEAAKICGFLFKGILDCKAYMRQVQDILQDSAGRNLVGDRLLKLGSSKNLFSKPAVDDQIQHVKNLYTELDGKIKEHRKRVRVRLLGRIIAFKCTAEAGLSKLKKIIRVLKSTVRGGGSGNAVSTSRSNSDERPIDPTLDDEEEHRTVPEPLHPQEDDPTWLRYLGLDFLQKLDVQLKELEKSMHAVNTTFNTLICQVEGTYIYLDDAFLIKGLRDELLSVEDVAERITEYHYSLSDHLEDLKVQALKCFWYVNDVRDVVYSLFRAP